MSRILGLAFVAALYPTLAAAVTLMLVMPKPKLLLVGYLLGAYTVSISLGLLFVFGLQDTGAASTSQNALSPAMDIGIGLLCLAAAFVLGTGRDARLSERRARKREQKGDPHWRQTLGKGSPRVTFVVGMLLSLPSVSYLVALSEIDKLGYGGAETITVVVGFNLIMFLIAEIPLISYAISPDATKRTVDRMKAWLERSGRKAAVSAAVIFGVLITVRGVASLLT